MTRTNAWEDCVVIVGQRDDGEWHYMASEPMGLVAAEKMLRTLRGRLDDDHMAVIRPVTCEPGDLPDGIWHRKGDGDG